MKTIKAIYNKISAFFNRYNPRAITSMIILLLDDVSKNKYSIKALQKFTRFNVDDIKAIQLTIKTMREDYESLKNKHNELAIDFNNYTTLDTHYEDSAKTSLLNTPFKDELTKPSKDVDDNILMLENVLKSIIEVKVNNACLLVQYGADITLDKEPYSKYSIKEILQHYIKNDDNHLFRLYNKGIDKIANLEARIVEYERLLTSDKNHILKGIAKILANYDDVDNVYNKFLYDVIDDINDEFNEFTNIYHDVYDDDNNINLTK